MKAIVQDGYGLDRLALREIDAPELAEDGVLVRVRASSVNAAEWYAVSGQPYVARPAMGLRKPKSLVPGADFAGTVEAVGEAVTDLQPGDAVFGGCVGAYAELVHSRRYAVPMPANLSFEEAAAVPTAAITALQALRDHGQVQPGQKVLVNGATGGVGSFAVQIAKAFGAEVTGVCSPGNVDLVRSIGADHVVDYSREDFTQGGECYDLVIDVAGSRGWSEVRRVLAEDATFVIVGGPKGHRWVGPLGHVVRNRLAARGASQKVVFFIAKFIREDFLALQELLDSGKVTPVIDRQYPLAEVASALAYFGEGHARGKIVLTV